MVTRPPAPELLEVAAWFVGPFAILLLALWAAIARRSARRDRRFAEETTRLDEQQRRELLARKGLPS